MKKLFAAALCVAMLLSLTACGRDKAAFNKTTEYYIDSYVIELPDTYVEQDLIEVKAESNCIAMLEDSSGKLPGLWIYEDVNDEDSLWDYVLKQDEIRDFTSIYLYGHDNSLAKTIYTENWYGDTLYNEQYYRIEGGNTVLSFDFACDNGDQSQYFDAIEDIVDILGF